MITANISAVDLGKFNGVLRWNATRVSPTLGELLLPMGSEKGDWHLATDGQDKNVRFRSA